MKVSVCVSVIDGSVVLVAVTVNDNCVPGAGIGWPRRLQVEAEDSRLTGRDRDAGAAVEEREAAGDVGNGEVVGVGRRAQVLDRGAEGGGKLGPVEGYREERCRSATEKLIPG